MLGRDTFRRTRSTPIWRQPPGQFARPVPTRYSGRRRSNAHASASSQWKVPLCVPIRGGAMRWLRGRLEGETGSKLSLRCGLRRGGGSNSTGKKPRRKRWPMQLSPRGASKGADPEGEAPAQPHFRLPAVPMATGSAESAGSPALIPVPGRFPSAAPKMSTASLLLIRLQAGAHPLTTALPPPHQSLA